MYSVKSGPKDSCVLPSTMKCRFPCSWCPGRGWHWEQQQQQSFYGPLPGTTRVSRYQKEHSPTHHPDHHLMFISFFHLLRSIAFSLFKLLAWQSFCTTSLHVLFSLPLGLEPSTSYSIHFVFTQSCLLFTTHAHTIATCFDVVSTLYHPFPVFLSTPYLELFTSENGHISHTTSWYANGVSWYSIPASDGSLVTQSAPVSEWVVS